MTKDTQHQQLDANIEREEEETEKPLISKSTDKEPVIVTINGKSVTRYITNWTTIRIRKQTRERLEEIADLVKGDSRESYDAVITKLLDKNDKGRK